MKKIFKYKLSNPYGDNQFELPKDYKIIRFDKVDNDYYIWAIVESLSNPLTHKCFNLKCVQLPVLEKFSLRLLKDSQILHVGDDNGKFYLWYINTHLLERETEIRNFECYKTGQVIDSSLEKLQYLGTCKLFIMMELCLYYFLVLE